MQTTTETTDKTQTTPTPQPAPECKLSPIEKLEAREKALAKQLKAIQLEIKTKKQRKAAQETNKKRKERQQNLILLGLAFAAMLADMPPEKAKIWTGEAAGQFEDAHAPTEETTEKEAEKHHRDCKILKIALEKAAKGEIK